MVNHKTQKNERKKEKERKKVKNTENRLTNKYWGQYEKCICTEKRHLWPASRK